MTVDDGTEYRVGELRGKHADGRYVVFEADCQHLTEKGAKRQAKQLNKDNVTEFESWGGKKEGQG